MMTAWDGLALQEALAPRDLLGAALILAGTLISQFLGKPREKAVFADAQHG